MISGFAVFGGLLNNFGAKEQMSPIFCRDGAKYSTREWSSRFLEYHTTRGESLVVLTTLKIVRPL